MSKEYRLYYDNQGTIYKGAKVDILLKEEESYIVVEKEVYMEQGSYKIVNGQLTKVQFPINTKKQFQFKKSDSGIRVVKNHIALLLFDHENYPTVEYYEYTNS